MLCQMCPVKRLAYAGPSKHAPGEQHPHHERSIPLFVEPVQQHVGARDHQMVGARRRPWAEHLFLHAAALGRTRSG
jgi:hypothetical protein